MHTPPAVSLSFHHPFLQKHPIRFLLTEMLVKQCRERCIECTRLLRTNLDTGTAADATVGYRSSLLTRYYGLGRALLYTGTTMVA